VAVRVAVAAERVAVMAVRVAIMAVHVAVTAVCVAVAAVHVAVCRRGVDTLSGCWWQMLVKKRKAKKQKHTGCLGGNAF
jgi:hypothetical protein